MALLTSDDTTNSSTANGNGNWTEHVETTEEAHFFDT